MEKVQPKVSAMDRIRTALGSKLVTLKREPCGCIAHSPRPVIGKAKIGSITVGIVGHDRLGRGLVQRSEIDRALDATFRK
ncbi:MAG: hypothetical protein AAB573_02595 [Patescibacteria group bacterium]